MLKTPPFFAKGVTLLYVKNNMKLLNEIIKNSKCGCFDISLVKKKTNVYLNTGKVLYYPTIDQFYKLINSSNKKFIFRNIKKNEGNKIYLEVIYGNEIIIKKLLSEMDSYKKKFQYKKNLRNLLGLNLKNFHNKLNLIKI